MPWRRNGNRLQRVSTFHLFNGNLKMFEEFPFFSREPVVITLSIEKNYCAESVPEQSTQQNQNHSLEKKIPSKAFLCEACGKSFLKIGQLKHHSISHGNIRAHICKICHKVREDTENCNK